MGEPSSQKVFWPAESFRVLKGRNVTTDNIGGKLRSSLAKKMPQLRTYISLRLFSRVSRVK